MREYIGHFHVSVSLEHIKLSNGDNKTNSRKIIQRLLLELAERDLFDPIHDIFLIKGYQVWITHDSTELGKDLVATKRGKHNFIMRVKKGKIDKRRWDTEVEPQLKQLMQTSVSISGVDESLPRLPLLIVIGNLTLNTKRAQAAIQLQSWGFYGITIKDNIVEPSSSASAPKYFIRADAPVMSVQINNNTVKYIPDTSLYFDVRFLPVEKSSPPTGHLTQKYGDIILNGTENFGWIVSSPIIGYGSLNTDVIGKVNIVKGSNYTVVSNVFGPNPKDPTGPQILINDYHWLPEGMNIYITGAGPAGNQLECCILENDGKIVTLDQYAQTTVYLADVKYQPFRYMEKKFPH